jgi:carboxypeptidase C (cathepsin A)
MNGTFASDRAVNTQDSTAIAARAFWHFLQGFLSAFPQYNPGTRPNRTTIEPAGVNLFAESYGGMYGPTFADYFEVQNDRRNNGSLPDSTLVIQLDSVGIINGAVDFLTEIISSPTSRTTTHMAYMRSIYSPTKTLYLRSNQKQAALVWSPTVAT